MNQQDSFILNWTLKTDNMSGEHNLLKNTLYVRLHTEKIVSYLQASNFLWHRITYTHTHKSEENHL